MNKIKKIILIFILLINFQTVSAEEFPIINSQKVYLYNMDTNEVIYEKNSQKIKY